MRTMGFVMHRKKKECLCEVVGTSTKNTNQYLNGIQFVACTWKAMQVVDVPRYLSCSIVLERVHRTYQLGYLLHLEAQQSAGFS